MTTSAFCGVAPGRIFITPIIVRKSRLCLASYRRHAAFCILPLRYLSSFLGVSSVTTEPSPSLIVSPIFGYSGPSVIVGYLIVIFFMGGFYQSEDSGLVVT